MYGVYISRLLSDQRTHFVCPLFKTQQDRKKISRFRQLYFQRICSQLYKHNNGGLSSLYTDSYISNSGKCSFMRFIIQVADWFTAYYIVITAIPMFLSTYT